MRLILALTTAIAGLSGQAAAETYAVRAATIENTAAVLTVIAEDRADIDVSVTAGAGGVPAPSVRVDGDHVLIDGGLHNRIRGCGGMFGGQQVRIDGIGNVHSADLPHITVRAPRSLALGISGGVFSNISASGGGEVTLSGCGETSIGATSGALSLGLNGSGDVRAGAVGGALVATVNGSGALRVESAGGDGRVHLNGSGDLVVGDIDGALDARLTGSGSMRVGSASGGARLQLTGSGDLDAGAISRSLEADLNGSGEVTVASIEGDSAKLELTASGDMRVRQGHVGHIDASSSGSGNLSFGGTAGASSITLRGSGDIAIADAGQVEQIADTGSGDAHLGH